ncbi:MAG TPA: tRNA (guanosine(46)-N7)-methyltransferase TrmB [Phycisphaeraceae bacterium]
MGLSLSRGRSLDPGSIGIERESLLPVEQGPIDLRSWFAGAEGDSGGDSESARRPIELEIGSGKGTFLVRQAALVPSVNYIGIEYAKAFWRYAADRCRRHGLTNVRLVHAEAGTFVRYMIPDAAIRQVHIYFPDPWPKKRHHKRRLIQQPFLLQLHRILESPRSDDPQAGLVRIATDHADYFAWMQEHAASAADWFEQLPFTSPVSAGQGELVGTNFERKYRREGRPFFGMILRKRG